MHEFETLEDFYLRHPVENQKTFSPHNAGRGHFNVFLRKNWCVTKRPFGRRDFYKIALVIGTGIMHYEDREVYIDKPALIFASPLVTSAWEPVSVQQEGWFCLFTEAFIESHEHKNTLIDFPLFKLGGNHIIFLDDIQLASISAMLSKMMEEMESDYAYKFDLLRNYLRILMHEALKIEPAETVDTNAGASARITAMFFDLLERQFPIDTPTEPLKLKTANDYAQHLSVHVNHLNRSVKETTGKTTTAHIAERVLKEAHALLKHTDWNIAQVANGLGFEEPAYFANFFKKHTGKSPGITRLATA
jgi:AraC family transcriptional activator of pobA